MNVAVQRIASISYMLSSKGKVQESFAPRTWFRCSVYRSQLSHADEAVAASLAGGKGPHLVPDCHCRFRLAQVTASHSGEPDRKNRSVRLPLRRFYYILKAIMSTSCTKFSLQQYEPSTYILLCPLKNPDFTCHSSVCATELCAGFRHVLPFTPTFDLAL